MMESSLLLIVGGSRIEYRIGLDSITVTKVLAAPE
jgi:hypothetical protein